MSEIKFVPRVTKPKVLERDIQKKCMKWLKEQPDIEVCWKASDMYTRGVSDIVLMMNGLFIAIELKKPGETPSGLQQGFIDTVNRCGGVSCYVDSLEELKYVIEYIRIEYEQEMAFLIGRRKRFEIVKTTKKPLEIKML